MPVMTVAERAVILPYPHPGQQIVRREAKRFNWLAAGRRWRKTTLAMSIAVEEAIAGKHVLWCAPVFDQVRVSWGETKRAAARVADFNMSRMTASFPGGGVITYRSLDNPDNVRGHTADGVVIDECASIASDAWHEVLRPMLIDTNGWMWAIGTPHGHNWFWREYQNALAREDSAAWNAPTLGVRIEDGQLLRDPHPLENPDIPFSELVDLYHTTPEHTFLQEILASFVAAGAAAWLREWAAPYRFDGADDTTSRLAVGRWLSYDTAFKDTSTSAYTACAVGELLPDYRLPLRHVWRDRLLFPQLVDRILTDVARWDRDEKLRGVLIEDKASGTSAYQTLMASGSDRLRSLLVPFQPHGSKEQRFEQAGVWVKNGMVQLPRPGAAVPWLLAFEEEAFEEGEFKDQRDAVAQLVLFLEHFLASGLQGRGRVPEELAA